MDFGFQRKNRNFLFVFFFVLVLGKAFFFWFWGDSGAGLLGGRLQGGGGGDETGGLAEVPDKGTPPCSVTVPRGDPSGPT